MEVSDVVSDEVLDVELGVVSEPVSGAASDLEVSCLWASLQSVPTFASLSAELAPERSER